MQTIFCLGIYSPCAISQNLVQEQWPESQLFVDEKDLTEAWINKKITAKGTLKHTFILETWSQRLEFPFPLSACILNETLKNLVQKPLGVFDGHGLCDLTVHDPSGERFTLTSKERDVLYLLMTQESIHRDQLLEQVWQWDNTFISHTLESHISSLRQKILKESCRPFSIICTQGEYRLMTHTQE